MKRHSLIAPCVLIAGVLTGTILGVETPDGEPGSGVALTKGERILVMQADDYFSGSKVVEGTGNALVQSVYNSLAQRRLSPTPGSYAAVINAVEECERVGCEFLLLPRIERYTAKSTLRSKVRVTFELIEASSREVVADCDATETGWRAQGERVQELMRPAVEACLNQLITVKGGEARAAVPTMDEFLVVPRSELWVLPGNEIDEDNDQLAVVLLDTLKRGDYKGELGPAGASSREIFKHAREMNCNRILSVDTGLVWTRREEPPADARPQLIVSLVNVANEEYVRTVVVEAEDLSWLGEGSALLPLLMETAVERLLNHSGSPVAPPEGVSLSLLEPATIIDRFQVKIPRSVRRKSPKGTVVVAFVVDETGRVVDPRITESVPELDKPVLNAVKRLRYLPARRDGEVCSMHRSLQFKMHANR